MQTTGVLVKRSTLYSLLQCMRARWSLLQLCSWWCSGYSMGVRWVFCGCSVDALWLSFVSSHPEVVSRLAAAVAVAISRAAVQARSIGRAAGLLYRWCGAVCLACCGGWPRGVWRCDAWRCDACGCEWVGLVCWCCDLAPTSGPGRGSRCTRWRARRRARPSRHNSTSRWL